MTPELAGILLYTLLQLLLGFAVYRLLRTEADYLLAGRKLGYVLVTFSVFARWFGAESCNGTAGAAYAQGAAGVSADPFGYGLCVLLMGSLFAVRFWKMKPVTVADFFRARCSRGRHLGGRSLRTREGCLCIRECLDLRRCDRRNVLPYQKGADHPGVTSQGGGRRGSPATMSSDWTILISCPWQHLQRPTSSHRSDDSRAV